MSALQETRRPADAAENSLLSRASRRRGADRAPLALLVQMRSSSFEKFVSDFAVNLSMTGIFIRTAHPRGLGAHIHFQFVLQDHGTGSTIIDGTARVVRVNPVGGAGTPGMGLEFITVDAEDMALIASLVRRNLTRGSHDAGTQRDDSKLVA